jgi:hypothetical protein
MREWINHTFNALHVYCRLRDLGVADRIARKIASLYEDLFASHLLYQ